MSFTINQIFEKSYPPAVADYCNDNGLKVVELEQQNGIRRFQIQENIVDIEEQAAFVREKRNQLLQKTDFTQTLDAPFSAEEKAKYAAYRAYLRAIPENPEFPVVDVKTFAEWLL